MFAVEVPKELLECRAVTRELDFSSVERIRHFRLVQEVFLRGIRIEGSDSVCVIHR